MRYNTYSEYLENKYGERVYKLPVNLPITCPNRDGTCSYGGCIFCGEVGAAFENLPPAMPVEEQINENMEFIGKKYKAQKFIAYFQNFTNTYMPLEEFKKNILHAIKDNVVEIAISTRPDCIRDDYMAFLNEVKEKHGINISIELGLQSVNYKTLKTINRGHTLAEFIDAVMTIQKYGFDVCAHLILNLPWDTIEDTIECAKIISALRIKQVKLHSLYIVKDTPLAKMYLDGKFDMGKYMDYVERVIIFLEYLSGDIIIQRVIGRAKEEYTIFSNYGTSWWKIKDTIDEEMEKRNTYQGRLCNYLNGSALKKFDI
jgi:radical SAM protein (TIGR01212 family)